MMNEPQTGEIRRIKGEVRAGYTTANLNVAVDDTMILPPSWYKRREMLEQNPPDRADTWEYRYLYKITCDTCDVLVLGWTYRQVGVYEPAQEHRYWDSPPEYDPPSTANERRLKVWMCMQLDKNGRYHKPIAVAEDQFVA